MSKFQLHDLSPKFQAQAIAQLHATPKPRTIAMEPAPEVVAKKRTKEAPDATPFFASAGLPAPVREHRFSQTRRFRFDYAWISQRVALEVEGGVWTGGRHTRGSGFMLDMVKYNLAATLGWRVLRCTPSQLRTDGTVQLLKSVLQ